MEPVQPGDEGALSRRVRRIHHLCYRMTLDEGEAEEACFETFDRAARAGQPGGGAGVDEWLHRTAAVVLLEQLPAAPEVTFERLDETLRSEATRTEEVRSLTRPERDYLLWQLKQGCMTAVLNCLGPGERLAFGADMLGLSEDEGAAMLDIKPAAFRVRLSRARKKIGGHLAPRCAHVDPGNPCHCPSRIGVALRKGFIAPPAQREVQLRPLPVFSEEGRTREAVSIYQTLPEPEPPADLWRRITALRLPPCWSTPPTSR